MAEQWVIEYDNHGNGSYSQWYNVGPADDYVATVPFPYDGGQDKALKNAHLIAAAPDLLESLEATKRLIDEALPKFNWGASALDANAIQLLNETPIKVNAAIAKARGETE